MSLIRKEKIIVDCDLSEDSLEVLSVSGPGGIRTHGLSLRRAVLYPAEVRGQLYSFLYHQMKPSSNGGGFTSLTTGLFFLVQRLKQRAFATDTDVIDVRCLSVHNTD